MAKKPCLTKMGSFYRKAIDASSGLFALAIVRVLGFIIDRMRLWRYELAYKSHLKVRSLHDTLVVKSPVYKKTTESKYAIPVRNATFAAFLFSFMIFTSVQYVLPLFDIFTPAKVQAGVNSKTWTTLADFINNNGDTGNITNTNTNINGGDPNITTTIDTKKRDTVFSDFTSSGNSSIGNTLSLAPPTVNIGTQIWMQYNLNVTTNPAGTAITRYCYGNDTNNCNTFGGLYTWSVAMNGSTTAGAQGICPAGFHIPTDDEWKTLEMHYGMTQLAADSSGYRGTDQGTLLKAAPFSGILAGYRSPSGAFGVLGARGFFWTSSDSGVDAWRRMLESGYAEVQRSTLTKTYGFSVRCLKN